MKKLFLLSSIILFVQMGFTAGVGSVTKANMLMSALVKKDFKLATSFIKEEPELLYTPNEDGMAPLALAVKNDDMFLFKFLVESGAPVTSPYYDTPLLILALYSDSKKTMVSLLELGVDAQVVYHGLSPLHIAVLLNRVDFINILLQYGVDPDQTDDKGLTPFYMAALKKQWDFVAILAKVTTNMNTLDPSGLTPLAYFIKESPGDLIDFVNAVDDSISKIYNFQSKKSLPPLLLALQEDNIDALQLLLEKGANVNIQSLSEKETPLMVAAQQNNEDAVRLILGYEPKAQLKNKKRKKAIDLAKPASDVMMLLADYSTK